MLAEILQDERADHVLIAGLEHGNVCVDFGHSANHAARAPDLARDTCRCAALASCHLIILSTQMVICE